MTEPTLPVSVTDDQKWEAFGRAVRRLVVCARTTGGTAGPDDGLMAACEVVEDALAGVGLAALQCAPSDDQERERLAVMCDDQAENWDDNARNSWLDGEDPTGDEEEAFRWRTIAALLRAAPQRVDGRRLIAELEAAVMNRAVHRQERAGSPVHPVRVQVVRDAP